MQDGPKTGKLQSGGRHNPRPTIGLFIGRLGDQRYQAHVWPGVADVAEERDVNLVCFAGGALRAPHEFDAQRNVAYDLAGPENVDGLVAMSGSLGQFIGPEQLRRFYERYRPLPIVNIAMALEGLPSVVVDNQKGMREAIAHLIEAHGCRRIAFIRGPEANPDAEQRYLAYAGTLAEHGLSLDPRLVVPGNFLAPTGAEAMRYLLDERQGQFEAVVTANDEMAMGALNTLHERGVRVPDDVRLVGFDDIEEAGFTDPPLTTVHQPLYQQGRRATELLLALLAGEKVPEREELPTELVVRHSCGCLSSQETPEAVAPLDWTGETFEAGLVAQRGRILTELQAVAGVSGAHLPAGWSERLLEAFSSALKNSSDNDFLTELDEILRQVGAEGHDVMQWQRVPAVLHRYALAGAIEAERRSKANFLWEQSKLLIGDVAQWAQAHRRIQSERRAFEFTTGISEPLMTTFDVDGLKNVVASQLPRMGIQSCYLSLYEQPAGREKDVPTKWSRLVLAYNRKGLIKLEGGGKRFRSRQLVPEGILPRENRYAIMLEPLHFRDVTQLGFILFGPLQTSAGALREALSRQISTALQGALLAQESRQAQEALLKSENKYRSLLEFNSEILRNIPIGVIRLDRQMRIQYENSELERIIGLPSGEHRSKALGMDIRELPGIREAGLVAEFNNLQKGKNILSETRFTSIYGKTTFLSFIGSPIREKGRLVGSVLLIEDITERKRAEDELKEYSERLQEMVDERTTELQEALKKAQMADRLKTEFIANVNHELRTPLTNLVLYHQMLRADPMAHTQERLGVIGREVQRLRNLIEELLNLSRLDLGQVSFRPLPLDPNALVQTLVDDRRAIAEEHHLTLTAELCPSLPSVWLDEAMIVQVMSNLLTNALNYTPAGGHVLVRTLLEDQSGKPWAGFRVQDTGPGIKQDDLPHLFERFYRGTSGHETGVPGTGLGLAIAKQGVEKHGGRIEVTNNPDGPGAIFTVWLPIEHDQGADAG
jgi:PAS domain S-box-containing protein